jgi:hypothetical protein
MLEKRLTIDRSIFTTRWRINISTIRTIQFDSIQTRYIGSSTRQDVCCVTEDSGACSEVALVVFLHLRISLLLLFMFVPFLSSFLSSLPPDWIED